MYRIAPPALMLQMLNGNHISVLGAQSCCLQDQVEAAEAAEDAALAQALKHMQDSLPESLQVCKHALAFLLLPPVHRAARSPPPAC